MQKGKTLEFAWNVQFFKQMCQCITKTKGCLSSKYICCVKLEFLAHIAVEIYVISYSIRTRIFKSKLFLYWWVSAYCCVWEVSGDSQIKTAKPVLLYIVQYFINSVHSPEIWPDIMLCVCVTHFAKGRKKVCRQNGTLSYRCLGQCTCKNQDMSASLVNVCGGVLLMNPMTQAGCLFPVSLPV